MRRLEYVVTTAAQGFWRNPVMSLASTFTVGLMLLLFAFFLATDRGLQAAVGVLESKVELALFLEDDARVSDVLDLRARIEADPAVSRVDYVTKEQAMARLVDIAAKRPDIQIVDTSENPLQASLEVKLAHAQDAPRVTAALRQEIGKGVVSDVVDNPQVVDKLLTITRVLSFGGLAVLAMMLIVALFVIVNTIRIAVHARRDEIEIMKLVGATDWFVRWPFILEGMLVGALGAVAATTVALVVSAFLGGLAQPASADDPVTAALKRKDELARAVQLSRANAERYQAVANQFQAVVNQTNARISDLAEKQANAQSEADQLFYQIQIAEEQLALVTFQLDETRALADSLQAEATQESKELADREDLYARHLRTTYRQALISPLEMLLSSASLTEFANRLQEMIFINRQDVQLANEIRNIRADTQQKQDDAASKEKEILGLTDQITTQRQQLSGAKDKYDKLVAQTQSAIDDVASVRAEAAGNRQAAH